MVSLRDMLVVLRDVLLLVVVTVMRRVVYWQSSLCIFV